MRSCDLPGLDFVAGLFDMDGTLVDSTALVESEWRAWASMKGLNPDTVARSSHGRRTEDVIRQYLPVADLERELSQFICMASSLDQTVAGPIPGAVNFVTSLAAHPWAVVTSAPRAIARQRLARCGFPEPPVLIGADDVRFGKPDPEGYLTAGHQLRVNPADCLAFEDAPSGIESARRAQIRVVAVETTHAREKLDCPVIVRDFRNLQVVHLSDGGLRLRVIAA
jgi:mannitol-1-/sugar-/sorbitol-6-phosphatase